MLSFSLGPGFAGKKAKNGMNGKNIGERSELSCAAGDGERAAEPGDMPLMPPS